MDMHEQWESFFNPQMLKDRLISASLFITAFEVLNDTIVGRLRDFYTFEINEEGAIINSEYKEKVLSRNRSPVFASLDWLKEQGAIDDSDLTTYKRIKAIRNDIAHEIPQLVFGDRDFNHVSVFNEIVELVRKIGVWWIMNVEIPTNPDYDGQPIDEEKVIPGSILTLQMMMLVLEGNEELLNAYRRARKQPDRDPPSNRGAGMPR